MLLEMFVEVMSMISIDTSHIEEWPLAVVFEVPVFDFRVCAGLLSTELVAGESEDLQAL